MQPRVVVVAGGTGLVGSAVVDALLARGDRVVVPTRGAAAAVPRGARVVPGTDWTQPDRLLGVLAEPGWAADAVVAALGGWWLGPDLVDLPVDVWRTLLESHLTAHWLAVRALAPALAGPDPAYVLLGGAAATEPMARSGPVSVTGAGQRMLLHVLRAEPIGGRVRFAEVAVPAAVAGDGRNLTPQTTLPRERVAATVLAVLDDPGSAAVVPVTP